MSAWWQLILAILLEVAGTTSMKLAAGFTRPVAAVMMLVFYLLSFVVFTFALKRLEISVAYAIWSGLGSTLIVLIGVFFFKETMSWVKLVSILLIIIGVIGLKLGASSPS